MYDYTGHSVRVAQREPGHLTGKVMHFRGAAWKRQMVPKKVCASPYSVVEAPRHPQTLNTNGHLTKKNIVAL